MRHNLLLIAPLLLLTLLISCKEGTKLDNLAPETQLFVESINLTGDDRLNSVVELHWSGEDQDGYVKGYEISFDEAIWQPVFTQDSTFRFSLDPGTDTTDIDFFVRAIDNEDLADPSPAYLLIPIKNTPPVASFDSVKVIPDTAYTVFSVLWAAEDSDGPETIDSIFVKINEGDWLGVDKLTSFISLVPNQPTQAGQQSAKVYTGAGASLQNKALNGLELDADNVLYLRARDIAGTYSEIDTSKVFYIKKQDGDLLILDGHEGGSAPTPESVYIPILQDVYSNYDLRPLTGPNAAIPAFWDPTFGLYLNLYDKVFWYDDGVERADGQMYMEIAAPMIQAYLNKGGKLLIITKFPNSFSNPETANQSAIFGFSPMDSLSTSSGQARIPTDSLVMPVATFATQFDTLQSTAFITGADPFYPKNDQDVIFEGQLFTSGGWVGPRAVCGKTTFSNNRTNQVFCSVEFHKLGARAGGLQTFFDQVLNTEFNW